MTERPAACARCGGALYEGIDGPDDTRSYSCLLCGELRFEELPTVGPLPPAPRGRPRKGGGPMDMASSALRPARMHSQPGCISHPAGCDAHDCPSCGQKTHGAWSDALPHHRLRICVFCQDARQSADAYAREVARRARRRPA